MAVNFKPNQNDYKNLTPFKSWLILQINTWGQNNFPFVESDFDELTNYGMMQKLMKAVNDVISNENMVEKDMTNIFNAYTELQNYVNTYFDNLDVQDEINNKLDEMAEDGTLTTLIGNYVDPFIEEQNNRITTFENTTNDTITNFENSTNNSINTINTKVNQVVSGSPLVASSTSGMTDTSRIYVNTSDGNWYYYNGTNWVVGGVYQSSGIDSNSISYDLTNFVKKGINEFLINNTLINGVNITQNNDGYISVVGTCAGNSLVVIGKIIVSANSTYKYNQLGAKTFPIYITDMSDNIIQTIGGSITNTSFELSQGTYKIKTYVNNGSTYNDNVFIQLYDTKNEMILRRFNWFKPNLHNIPNDNFNSDNNQISDFDSINGLSISIDSDYPFIFDKDNLEFIINDGWLIYKDNFYPTIKGGISSYKNTSVISNYTKTIDLSTASSGLNGIFFNIKTCATSLLNFDKWANPEYTDKYDVPLMFFFYNASYSMITDYFILSKSIKENSYSKKYLSICGVSIDTYQGFIPSPNVSYYNSNNLGNVYVTWWKRLLTKLNLKLLVNNSWTGARASTSNGVTSSGVHRCLSLDDGTHTPDYIIIGAFALNEWTNSEIGEYEIGRTSLAPITADLTDEAVYNQYKSVTDTYKGAMATMINRIQKKYPNAKLFAMDSYNYYRDGVNPTYNASPYRCLNDYNEALYDVCEKFGVEVIKLSECGLTATNSLTYTIDGQTTGTIGIHPDAVGMKMLYEETLKHFK